MPLAPKPLDPADFGPPEIFEAFYLIQYINDDGIAIMHSKPVIKWSLSPRPGDLYMLSAASFNGSGRKTHIAIDEL
jgi:hypothetical protein